MVLSQKYFLSPIMPKVHEQLEVHDLETSLNHLSAMRTYIKKEEGILASDDVPEIGTGYCIGYRIGMDLVNLMERSNPMKKGSNPREKLILKGLNPKK